MSTARTRRRKRVARRPVGLQDIVSAAPWAEARPPRGLKLKTVSNFTMVFGLLCLAALLAGRPPASAAGSEAAADGKESPAQIQRAAIFQGMMIREGSFVSSAGSGNRSRRNPRNARERGRPLVSCLAIRNRNTSN